MEEKEEEGRGGRDEPGTAEKEEEGRDEGGSLPMTPMATPSPTAPTSLEVCEVEGREEKAEDGRDAGAMVEKEEEEEEGRDAASPPPSGSLPMAPRSPLVPPAV
jgi:hypothetical protein